MPSEGADCGRAGTLISRSNFLPSHLGQETGSSPRTSSSKVCSHFRQANSYNGTADLRTLLSTLAVDLTGAHEDLLFALGQAALAVPGDLGQHLIQLGLEVLVRLHVLGN